MCLMPEWVNSYSLRLSWAAALALSLPRPRGWRGGLHAALAVWMLLSPLLPAAPHPLTWLVNLLLAPIFSAAALPLAFVATLNGPFTWPFDHFMAGFLAVLSALEPAFPPPPVFTPGDTHWQWAWIAVVHGATHGACVYATRAKIQRSYT